MSKHALRGWWIVAASFIGLAFSLGPLLVLTFGVFVKPLAAEFHATRGAVALAASVLDVMVTLAAPLAGVLVDRYGARRVLVPSILLLAMCVLGLAAAHPPMWHLYVCFGLAGLLGVASTPLSYARVIITWFDQRRGLALGVAGSGVGLGAILLPPFAQHLVERAGWRSAYLGIAAVSVAVAVPFALTVRTRALATTGDRQVAAATEPDGLPVIEALSTGRFWLMCVVFFSVAACVNGAIAHLVPLLTDRGLAGKTAAFAVSVFGITTTLGRIGAGHLVDRFRAERVAALMFSGAALGMAILWTRAHGIAPFVASALFGLAVGTETDVMPYFVSRIFGERSMAKLFGGVFSSFTLGTATGRYLFGAAFDAYGSYRPPLLCALAVMLVASALVLGLSNARETA